jgi:hypothetical protein
VPRCGKVRCCLYFRVGRREEVTEERRERRERKEVRRGETGKAGCAREPPSFKSLFIASSHVSLGRPLPLLVFLGRLKIPLRIGASESLRWI